MAKANPSAFPGLPGFFGFLAASGKRPGVLDCMQQVPNVLRIPQTPYSCRRAASCVPISMLVEYVHCWYPPIAPSPCTLDEIADFVDRADRVLQRCSRDPVARLFSSNFDLSAARTLHSQVLHTLPALTRIGEHDENQLPSQQCRS